VGYITVLIISIFLDLPLWGVIIGACFIYFGNELRNFQKNTFPELNDKSSNFILIYGVCIIILSIVNTLLILSLQTNVGEIAAGGVDSVRSTFLSVTLYLAIVQILDMILTIGLVYGLVKFVKFINENLKEHFLYRDMKGKFVLFYLAPLGQIFVTLLTFLATNQMADAFRGLHTVDDISEVSLALEQIESFMIFIGFMALGILIVFIYSANILRKFFDFPSLPRIPPLSYTYRYPTTLSRNLRYCGTCGYQNPATAKFCMECGLKIEGTGIICTNCSRYMEEKTSYCPYCGTWMKEE
jgi:RNA polymerase subunit RPABC4/transcription elongation factor Spt4